ncbi:MAG: electron transfer flavoprotein subunit beta/FixA family protein [Pseudomonadota bacterium]
MSEITMGLHIIVCIKSVTLQPPDAKGVRSPESFEMNPFDRPALEAGLRLRETFGGKVTALSMGPELFRNALFEALAMGVDESILVSDPALAGSDTLATSTALAEAVKKLSPFDLLFFGTRAADSDTGHVGPQTAVVLDLPMVSGVTKIEKTDKGLLVERRIDDSLERYEIVLPAALTLHHRSTPARDAGLPGIQTAFEGKEVKTWSLKDLGLTPENVGEQGSGTKVISLSRVKKERKCEFLSGSAEELADELIERLSDSGLIS